MQGKFMNLFHNEMKHKKDPVENYHRRCLNSEEFKIKIELVEFH